MYIHLYVFFQIAFRVWHRVIFKAEHSWFAFFSYTGCCTKTKDLNWPWYFHIGEKKGEIYAFLKGIRTNSKLNFVCSFSFL